MRLNSAYHADSHRQENWASRIFSFIGLMTFCVGLLVIYTAIRSLWNEWPADPSDITRMVAVRRWHLLAGIVWLTAAGFIGRERWMLGGLLLVLGLAVFLDAGGDR